MIPVGENIPAGRDMRNENGCSYCDQLFFIANRYFYDQKKIIRKRSYSDYTETDYFRQTRNVQM